MIFSKAKPSLKRRLLLTLLAPFCLLLLVLGGLGIWLANRMVESASDRVLSGSLQAISETLTMQQGYLTLDLPPSALGMLENADRDNVYYNVSYRNQLITGYPELSVLQSQSAPLDEIEFRYGTFHGTPIRVASEAKLVPQLDAPVIVQVAETTKNRVAQADRISLGLIATEIALLAAIATLVFVAVDWGLKPLSVLRREVEVRSHSPDMNLAPLPLSLVPHEALPFVSEFNALLRHVETTFETLKRFTSDASHQLRAPLTVVRTHLELLGRHPGKSAEERDAISDMHAAVRALQHLIIQLVSLAKAERPKEDSERHHFDLVDCAANVARTYATHALGRGMELSFETDCEKFMVNGNPIFASEMIANLLDNSIRYGETGGHVVVRICMEQSILEIEDDGPGIPQKDHERVFERFYRLPRNTDREGSGLGLSIVQALGRRMDATVALKSPDKGDGLKVTVRFQPVH